MSPAALLVLGQDAFVERQLGAVFCGQSLRRLREACLLRWRRPGCGC